MKKANLLCLCPWDVPTQIKKGITFVLQQHKKGSGEEGSRTLHFIEKQFHSYATDLDFFFFMCWSSHSKLQFLWQKRQSELNHISAASCDPIAYCLPTYSTCCFPLPLSITYSEVWKRKWGNSFLLFSQLTVSLWWHCNPGGGKETGTGQLHMWSKFTLKNKTEAYGLTLTARSSPEYKTGLLS